MKFGVLGAIIAAIMGIFGGSPAAQTAAVANATAAPTPPAQTQQIVITPAFTPNATTTIIETPIIQRIVENHTDPSGITPQTLAAILTDFEQSISNKFSSLQPASIPQNVAAQGFSAGYGFPSSSQGIGQLANTAINNPTISGGSISGATIAGYLPLSGGTLTGDLSGTNLTLSGALTAGTLNVAGVSSGGAIFAPYFSATSTTATSTFAGGIAGPNNFVIQQGTGNVGIGTNAPIASLDIEGTSSGIYLGRNQTDHFVYLQAGASGGYTGNTFAIWNGMTGAWQGLIMQFNNSPGLLAFNRDVPFGATTIQGNSTTTPALTVTQNSTANILNLGTTGGTKLVVSNSGNVGIGTTNPTYLLDVNGTGHFNSFVDAANFVATSSTATSTFAGGFNVANGGLVYDRSTGFVGIGTTSPTVKLLVNGAINQNVIATGGAANYFKTNGLNTASTTDLNAGVLLFGDSFGMDLGYDAISGAYRNRIFTQNFQDIGFSRTAIGPTSQSSFTEMMTISHIDNGNVGIATTTPKGRLVVSGVNTGSGVTFQTTNSQGTPLTTFLNNGNLGIGTTSPTTALQVNGVITPNADNTSSLGNSTYRWSAVYAANGTIQTSDARLKSNITDLNYGLSDILKLHPVSFTWSTHPEQGTKLGFVAQEVQPIMPETVTVGDDANHTLGITYTEFIPAIVKSIQDIAHVGGSFRDGVIAWLGDAGNGIDYLFARNVYATNVQAHMVTADELCAKKTDGTAVCVTGDQLAAVLSAVGAQGAPVSGSSAPPASDASATSSAPSDTQSTATTSDSGTGDSSSQATDPSSSDSAAQ